MSRLSHWTVALLLLPTLWASLIILANMAPAFLSEGFKNWWLYCAGAGAYLLIDWLLAKPMWLYVFGHEATHVVSGLLSGARIHSFKAASDGGEVKLSKSNAFIALSPYIFPFYALVIIGLFAIVKFWWNQPELSMAFRFLLGMALAFHFSLTFSAVHRHQPDLKVLGFFLSGVLILLGNSLILGVLSVSLFQKTPTLSTYASRLGTETMAIWRSGFELAREEFKKHDLWTQ